MVQGSWRGEEGEYQSKQLVCFIEFYHVTIDMSITFYMLQFPNEYLHYINSQQQKYIKAFLN